MKNTKEVSQTKRIVSKQENSVQVPYIAKFEQKNNYLINHIGPISFLSILFWRECAYCRVYIEIKGELAGVCPLLLL